MAAIGDAYPPEKRQVAISKFITMNLLAQIFATTASGLIGESFGWRIVIFASACIAIVAAIATRAMLPIEEPSGQRFTLGAVARNYRIAFRNPKAILCYSAVFLEGVALFGILPYVGDILIRQSKGGVAEAGIIIGALGVGGLVYVLLVARLLRCFT